MTNPLPILKARNSHDQMEGLLRVWEQLGTDNPFPMPFGPSALWVGAWYDGCLGVFNVEGELVPSPFSAEDIPFSKEALLERRAQHMDRVDYDAIRKASTGRSIKAPGHLGGRR